ncbi:MAG: cache domain-containing protein, partial [Acidobacteriota bacterium]
MATKPRPPKKSRKGTRPAPKKSVRRGPPLGLLIAGLVALAVVVTAGAAIVVSSSAGERAARLTVATDLGGSQAVQTAFQQQRYQRLNLISRIFATDQVLTSYLAEAAQKRDEAAILASVEEYQNLLTFDLAVVMDRNGVVLTRTDSRSATQEDLSSTPLVAVALEESKASGVWQQGEQLFHAVAVPLVRQFELVGYIAVAYAINDTLAVQTKRAGGAETVFLANAATGPSATASTLDDGKTASLIDALRRAGDVLNRVIDRGETASDVELD